MRDIILSLLLLSSLPVAVARPFVGVAFFAWVSLMNPHRLAWGFSRELPWAQLVALATLIGFVFDSRTVVLDSVRRYGVVLLYAIWMSVTTYFALEPDQAKYRWEEVMKIHIMCFISLCLLTNVQRVRILLYVIVLSIAFYGVKGGLFTLASGGAMRVWGPPGSAIEDNNHLAVATVMMVPLVYWMWTVEKRKWLRNGYLVSMVLMCFSILGSQSRGALLAIGAMAFMLAMKSQQKVLAFVVMALIALAALPFMPDKYWDRMSTITEYHEDSSALGRINVWKTAINIANDRLTGGGFEYYGPAAFEKYAPNPEDIHSAHSIYFQSLGEHGWIGISLFLSFLGLVWLNNRRIAKLVREHPEHAQWGLLARMLMVSYLGYCVGGAFVNISQWDGVYYLAIVSFGLHRALLVEIARAAQPVDEEAIARSERRMRRFLPRRT